MSIELIRELTTKVLETTNSNLLTIYIAEAIGQEPAATTVARIGGVPIGITPMTWPRLNGLPMAHLLTIDLDDMPKLKTDTLANARAVALFISDRIDNGAYEPHTPETVLIALSQDDIDQGEPSETLRESDQASGYRLTPVKVPESIFDEPEEYDEENPLEQLRNAVFSASYAAGKPIWLQSDEYDGHFLLQFDEAFIDMNLGDAGVMYVFADTAFWQCC
jgi:uncharacterized protein YwqG